MDKLDFKFQLLPSCGQSVDTTYWTTKSYTQFHKKKCTLIIVGILQCVIPLKEVLFLLKFYLEHFHIKLPNLGT
jgi:hypothetical protein